MISIIAAIGKNRELGKNNKLLWHLPEDMRRFKQLTQGYAVIMGRKTFESLGSKPLTNRLNIVITRDINYKVHTTVKICQSLDEAIKIAKTLLPKKSEIFIIGGTQIYQQAMPLADKLYLTIVDACFDADVFFPDYSKFTKMISCEEKKSPQFNYRFVVFEK